MKGILIPPCQSFSCATYFFLSNIVNIHSLLVKDSTNFLLDTTRYLRNLIQHRIFWIISMRQNPNPFCISPVLDRFIESTIGLWNSSPMVCESDNNDIIRGFNKNLWTISNKLGTMLSVEQPLASCHYIVITIVFNRPGVAGAVLQSPPSLTDWFIHSFIHSSFSQNIFQTRSIPNRKS